MMMVGLTTFSFAQTTTRIPLHRYNCMGLLSSNTYEIEQVVGDSEYKVWTMYYQNSKYEHIVDLGYIHFYSEEDVLKFAEDMQFFLTQGNADVTTRGNGYRLSNRGKFIFIYDDDGKYTYVTKKKAFKLIADIKNHAHLMN